MAFDVRPADVFDDVATLLSPKDRTKQSCWCLSYRLPYPERRAMTGQDQAEYVAGLCARTPAPGVVAYDGEMPVGWAGVAPRAELHAFTHGRVIPTVDDLPVWSVWCFKVRGGHRKQGIAHALLDGAVAFARESGAPALEGYPVDTGDRRVDAISAFVGTRRMFEAAGFTKAADTDSTRGEFPRVLMRLDLR
ncbi:GNAT family N-acetyltransferase [Microbacterium sp. 1P10UB]|uniref:GNAT family N-acetyltransferase n=1 Tax=unclassified Microbacterium TaxID=2609290 RepID=UPI0039A05745